MVYGELKHFVWYMVNFEETQWYIMKYPLLLLLLLFKKTDVTQYDR